MSHRSSQKRCAVAGCSRIASKDLFCGWCYMLQVDDPDSPMDISGWQYRIVGGVRRWVQPRQVAS